MPTPQPTNHPTAHTSFPPFIRTGQAPSTLLGAVIESSRKGLGLSQTALARLCGCSCSYICKIEHGDSGIGPELLHRLETILNLPSVAKAKAAGDFYVI